MSVVQNLVGIIVSIICRFQYFARYDGKSLFTPPNGGIGRT